MKRVFKAILFAPILIIAAYIFFLWATYIDDVVESGEKYSLKIGTTKTQTYKNIAVIKEQNPELKIYISYGKRAGDNLTLSPTMDNFEKINKYDHWKLLLDGEGEFFNIIRLDFQNGNLIQIYRHRKYFELP